MVDQNSGLSIRQHQILEELEECDDEMSGQQLYRALQEGSSRMGLTTVYRNLRGLQQKGMVRCRNLPTGEALYAPVARDQHHLTCVDCGQTIVLKFCPLNNLDLPKAQTKNFELLFHTLEFFGLCKNCSQLKKT